MVFQPVHIIKPFSTNTRARHTGADSHISADHLCSNDFTKAVSLNSKTLPRTILLSVFWAQVLRCKFTTEGFLCTPCLQFTRFQEDEVKKIESTKQLVLSVTVSLV